MGFKDYLPMILGFEGGFVDDPDDPGGRTNQGVTQKTYNDYRNRKKLEKADVLHITPEEVSEIYEGYYRACYADKIDNVNPAVAVQVFDFAINAGNVTAVKALQKMLGAEPDGIYGPKTEAALRNDTIQIGATTVAKLYAYQRFRYYVSLAIRKPVLKKFLTSWTSRTLVAAGDKL